MSDFSAIIVGAGAAGLSAAYELSKAGLRVMVLEARPRLGGRIYTTSGGSGVPVELGAEFIHGKSPEIWELIERAHLPTREVTNRHWLRTDSQLTELRGFWEGLTRILEKIDPTQSDRSFAEFLASIPDVSPEWKRLATDFVEGFNAAHPERISVHALAKDQEASERLQTEQSFRVTTGYAKLIQWLESQLEPNGVAVYRKVTVRTIRWQKGAVEVSGEGPDGTNIFEAPQAIITLPLGVLKGGEVTFEPEIRDKQEAIEGLEMGKVVKVSLQFRSRFWPEPNFGFIHATDESLPTWWTDGANRLTGWAGGARAERMAGQHVVAQATKSLSHIFQIEERAVNEQLEEVYFHDWTADPFARGAYSYIPVGMLDVQQHLAQPVDETLFFAGEATNLDGQLGTVHGAISSGKRAAQELISSAVLSTHPV